MAVPSVPGGREAAAKAALSAAHADDPTRVLWAEDEHPLEQALAESALRWLAHLDPGADELRRLAVYGHHLRRWEVPREQYPEGRAGYLRWRTDQKRRHAEDLGAILAEAGYQQAEVERVQRLVRKEGLGRAADPEVQAQEDAVCLAFLEVQLDATTERLGEERMVPVLQKTLAKMSEAGQALVAEVPLSERGRALLERLREA